MKQSLPPCCTAMPLAMGMRGEQKLPTGNFSFPCRQGEGEEIFSFTLHSQLPYATSGVAKQEQKNFVIPTYYSETK